MDNDDPMLADDEPVSRRQMFSTRRAATMKGNRATQHFVAADRAEGLGWQYDGLGSWGTDAIFTRLRELGVDTSPEQFHSQAEAAGSCEALADAWADPAGEPGAWEEYPFLAAVELWKRLAPDLPSPEVVADRLDSVIYWGPDAPASDGERMAALLDALQYLVGHLEGFAVEERAAALQAVCRCGTPDYRRWARMVGAVLVRLDPAKISHAMDVLAEADEPEPYLVDLPLALAIADRTEDARERLRQNAERFPDSFRVFVRNGDAHLVLKEPEESRDCYQQALALAGAPVLWELVGDRLRLALDALSQAGMWEVIRRRHPIPPQPATPVERARAEALAKELQVSSHAPLPRTKVGRNDPCPCGSGKKFKRCCGA